MLLTRPGILFIFPFEAPSLGIETVEIAAGAEKPVAELCSTALVATVVGTAALLFVLADPGLETRTVNSETDTRFISLVNRLHMPVPLQHTDASHLHLLPKFSRIVTLKLVSPSVTPVSVEAYLFHDVKRLPITLFDLVSTRSCQMN